MKEKLLLNWLVSEQVDLSQCPSAIGLSDNHANSEHNNCDECMTLALNDKAVELIKEHEKMNKL